MECSDLILSVLQYLPSRSLSQVMLVNKRWNSCARYAHLWKNVPLQAYDRLCKMVVNPENFHPIVDVDFVCPADKPIAKIIDVKFGDVDSDSIISFSTKGYRVRHLHITEGTYLFSIYQELIRSTRLTLQSINIKGRLSCTDTYPVLRSVRCTSFYLDDHILVPELKDIIIHDAIEIRQSTLKLDKITVITTDHKVMSKYAQMLSYKKIEVSLFILVIRKPLNWLFLREILALSRILDDKLEIKLCPNNYETIYKSMMRII